MYNINSSLIHGLALAWAKKKYPGELDNRYQRERIDVRVYELTGAGYYFIAGIAPGKWYYKSDPTENHFCNCPLTEVQKAIDAGGRVQIVGDRGKSLGVWENWQKFAEEILNQKKGVI